jgi:hypothetical protein
MSHAYAERNICPIFTIPIFTISARSAAQDIVEYHRRCEMAEIVHEGVFTIPPPATPFFAVRAKCGDNTARVITTNARNVTCRRCQEASGAGSQPLSMKSREVVNSDENDQSLFQDGK